MNNVKKLMLPTKKTQTAEEILARIEGLIANPPENSRIIEFTPEVAAVILENRNSGNRTKKREKIKEYAADMSADEWGLTGATIVFGTDGKLRDGQNRLTACVQSGKPFRTHVVFGIDPALFMKMDIGKVRNHSDMFAISKVPYASDAAAAVRWLLILRSGNPLSRKTISNAVLMNAYKQVDAEKIAESVKIGQRMRLTLAHPAGCMAALHYLFAEKNKDKADEFFEHWLAGKWSKRYDVVKLLQDILLSMKGQGNGRIHDGVRNALVILAWNAYATDTQKTAKLAWHVGYEFPEIKG